MERRGSDPKCQVGLLFFLQEPGLLLILLDSLSFPSYPCHCFQAPDHTAAAPGKAGWLCLQLPHRPSLSLSHYSYWPGLFVAQGHEEDIPPILQSLSLIEMGNKTTLQKKSLLWAALLEENESPKQIGFHDLRQTSLFILYNPV